MAEAAKMASILYKENHSDYDNKKSTIFINGNWDKDIRKKKTELDNFKTKILEDFRIHLYDDIISSLKNKD